MNAFLASALRQIREFFAKLSRRDKIRLGILAVLIIVFSIALATVLGRVNYATLYSGLSNTEGGNIIAALQEMGVTYKAQGDSILVPADQVGELRMSLEAQGIQGGDLPTNILDRALGFGVTSEDRETYTLLQKQSDLRNYIKSMEKIDDCSITLNLSKDSMFAKAVIAPATAAILLKLKDGATLTTAEAHSIGVYVMGAVPGLLAENISIVDTKMNLYSVAAEGESTGGTALDYQYELRERVQKDLEAQVTNFLIPVFGEGHVRAAVGVTLNFDKELVSSVEFAPPVEGETEGIVVSMQELYESSRYDTGAEGIPGTDTNGLGDPEYPYRPLAEDELYYKALREMNYEINETRTEIERAQGTIRSLSIAIMLDSNFIEEDYSANVRELVAQAIGVNNRYISVQRLPFQLATDDFESTRAQDEAFMRSMQNRELIKTAIIALAVVLLALLVFSFIRTILRTFAPPLPQPALAMAGMGGSVDYLSMEDAMMLQESGGPEADIPISTKSEAVEQLEKFIERDPQAVAQLLRNWLNDDYR